VVLFEITSNPSPKVRNRWTGLLSSPTDGSLMLEPPFDQTKAWTTSRVCPRRGGV
jgi:hypothetical protein